MPEYISQSPFDERFKTVLFVGGSLDGTTALVDAYADSYHVEHSGLGNNKPETYVRLFLNMPRDAQEVFAPHDMTPSQFMAMLIRGYKPPTS